MRLVNVRLLLFKRAALEAPRVTAAESIEILAFGFLE
jgi:hypothetical protein